MTEATPTPTPPTIRPMTKIARLGARPVTIALMRNRTAAIFMVNSRPKRSANLPGRQGADGSAQQGRGDGEAERPRGRIELVRRRRRRRR